MQGHGGGRSVLGKCRNKNPWRWRGTDDFGTELETMLPGGEAIGWRNHFDIQTFLPFYLLSLASFLSSFLPSFRGGPACVLGSNTSWAIFTSCTPTAAPPMSMKDKVGKVKEEHGGAVCAMQGGIFQVRPPPPPPAQVLTSVFLACTPSVAPPTSL